MPPGPGSIISSGFGQAGQHPVAVGFVASFCQSREGGFRIRLPCCCLCVTPFPSDADSNAKSCPSPKDRSGSSGPFFLLCRQSERQNRPSAGRHVPTADSGRADAFVRPLPQAGMRAWGSGAYPIAPDEKSHVCGEHQAHVGIPLQVFSACQLCLFLISASILRSIRLLLTKRRVLS